MRVPPRGSAIPSAGAIFSRSPPRGRRAAARRCGVPDSADGLAPRSIAEDRRQAREEAAPWRALAALVGALPFGALAWLGAWLGWVAGSVLRIRRAHVEQA